MADDPIVTDDDAKAMMGGVRVFCFFLLGYGIMAIVVGALSLLGFNGMRWGLELPAVIIFSGVSALAFRIVLYHGARLFARGMLAAIRRP